MGWGMARPEYYDRTPSSQYTNTTIVGDDISYTGADGRIYATDIRAVRAALAAWETLDRRWVSSLQDQVIGRHNALNDRLDAAGWQSQGAGGGKTDFLPPEYWENIEDPPSTLLLLCIPHRPYPGWDEDMGRVERAADEWFAANVEAI